MSFGSPRLGLLSLRNGATQVPVQQQQLGVDDLGGAKPGPLEGEERAGRFGNPPAQGAVDVVRKRLVLHDCAHRGGKSGAHPMSSMVPLWYRRGSIWV